MTTKTIPLDSITHDAETQARAALNSETVQEYADAMSEGDTFPPVVVYHDGSAYYLADGFHRVMAAVRIGARDIVADVRKGGRQEAIWHALGANRTQGQRMTRADVRHAIGLALRAFAEKSNREIARQVGCTDKTVAEERKLRESRAEIPHATTRTDSMGRQQPAHREPAAHAEPEPADDPADGFEEPEEEEPAPRPTTRGRGVQLANDAIAILQRIPIDDPLRAIGLQTVTKWIKANR